MIDQTYQLGSTIATVSGDHKSLTFTYTDRYVGHIRKTFTPALGKYEVMVSCNKDDKEEVIKYIKESIL